MAGPSSAGEARTTVGATPSPHDNAWSAFLAVTCNDTDWPENVLVLQNMRDPATPHLGGQLARAAFGDRARLVSVDGGGHGVYVYDDNPCALNTTTRFLLDGDLPESDVFCGASTTSGLALDE